MKKELLEKIEQEQKAEQEKQLNKVIESLVNDTIKQSKQEVQSEKPNGHSVANKIIMRILKSKQKSMKKAVRKQIKKPQPIVIDLSTISLEDLMAEAKKRGYVMNKYQKPKIITTFQEQILANTIDDLDLLSDDEEE